jgi:hypothetical protein
MLVFIAGKLPTAFILQIFLSEHCQYVNKITLSVEGIFNTHCFTKRLGGYEIYLYTRYDLSGCSPSLVVVIKL